MTLTRQIAALRDRLDRRVRKDEPCPASNVTCILVRRDGEARPEVPANAHRCHLCGRPHVLVIHRRVVSTPAEVLAGVAAGNK
jgi:hypothetical protein